MNLPESQKLSGSNGRNILRNTAIERRVSQSRKRDLIYSRTFAPVRVEKLRVVVDGVLAASWSPLNPEVSIDVGQLLQIRTGAVASTICQRRGARRVALNLGGSLKGQGRAAGVPREILPGSRGIRTTHVAQSCRATDPFHPKRAIQTLDVR